MDAKGQTTPAAAEAEPVKELFPGHAAELARRERRVAATAQANADPLPGPLADVFGHVPQTIAGLTVRPLVHYDFVLLKKLGSPLLDQLSKVGSGDEGKSETPFTDEQGYEMIYQFTRPAKLAAAVLARGREVFAQAALEEIGMSLGPVDVAALVVAVQREFVRAFSTAVKYGSPAPDVESGTVFSVPPAEAPATASAGGSIISAGSRAPSQASRGTSSCGS